MSKLLEKRNSYISKSILSILQPTHTLPVSKPASVQHIISSSILILVSVISVWAICFFVILGLCYHFNSGILLQDLNYNRLSQLTDLRLFNHEIQRQYSQLSFHCFFSVCLYLILLIICLSFLYFRQKNEKQVAYQDPK